MVGLEPVLLFDRGENVLGLRAVLTGVKADCANAIHGDPPRSCTRSAIRNGIDYLDIAAELDS
jgi:hypothetical protein